MEVWEVVMLKTPTGAFLLVLFTGCFVSFPAWGYIDPGSGHLILQVLAGAFVGALFYVKQILAFFRGLVAPKKPSSSPDASKEQPPDTRAAG